MSEEKITIKRISIILLAIVCLFSSFKVMAQNPAFYITDVKVSDKTDTAIINDMDFEKLSISSDISFHALDDYITYEIAIKNNTDQDYTLKSVSTTSDNDFITYSCDNCNNIKAPKNSEIRIFLTARYITQLEDMQKRSQNTEFELQLKITDTDGNIVNPNTGDDIDIYIFLAFISFVSLIILTISSKNNRKEKIEILIATFLIATLSPAIVSAEDTTVTIKVESKIKLFDRVVVTTIDENNEEHETLEDYGKKIQVPGDLEKDGYKFLGWYDEDDNRLTGEVDADRDIVFIPKWELINYEITLEEVDGIANPQFTIESEDFELPIPSKTGYIFDGWTGPGFDSPQINVTIPKGTFNDRIYVANWTPIVYTITYVLNGGTLETDNPNTYTIESNNIKLNDPSKPGYYFAGWTGSNGTTPNPDITIPKGSIGNKTYTANFAQYSPAALRPFELSGDSTVSWDFNTATDVYTIVQNGNTPGWGVGVVCDGSTTNINWGQSYMLEFEVMVPNTLILTTDGNTRFASDGTGNDIYGDSWLIIDGVRYNGEQGALPSGHVITGGTWHKVQMFLKNNNETLNPTHAPIISFSGFGLDLTDVDTNIQYYMRSLKSVVY